MPVLTAITFVFFILFNLSFWIKKDARIYDPLLFAGLCFGYFSHSINLSGLLIIFFAFTGFYKYFNKRHIFLFLALSTLILSFPLKLLSGFNSLFITPKFAINFSAISLASIPLILHTQFSKNINDIKKVLSGIGMGLVGIAILAFFATITKVTNWQMKVPSFFLLRLLSNLFLTCISQEILYRDFIQKEMGYFLKKIRYQNGISILLTSVIFTFAHIYWSPNLAVGLFVFLASLLYGIVYFKTSKIEAAIITHFILNLMHMLFFQYHAA